ncbi:ATP-dependent nuclease [Curtobacterium flaccumfaciens]|uniref:ATP-dependent nuclease n=1 Tax=Curtobacterium flaccumfaciens TaxID=2035 RepID=UPI002175D98F|nr:ATP-binding protein [Curtobacterium flaccumfaciens]MCS5495277.1 ATP-binding protein [Curtobacterium flaccumfaciens pv. flaccumfaciens]
MKILIESAEDALDYSEDEYLSLRPTFWNDWWKYRTLFDVRYVKNQEATHVGAIKIAQLGFDYEKDLSGSGTSTELPQQSFESLPDQFVSLGQDEDFYRNIRTLLGRRKTLALLHALNDLALDLDRFEEVRLQPVVSGSLLRSISARDVRNVFRAAIDGKRSRASFDFSFVTQWDSSNDLEDRVKLAFRVELESNPPTNVHAIIGRNGSGKSTLLQSLARTVLNPPGATSGAFVDREGESINPDISNLVYVSFSAFDKLRVPVWTTNRNYEIPYTFVGLQDLAKEYGEASLREDFVEDLDGERQTRRPDELAEDFARSVQGIMYEKSPSAWRQALVTLESDPLFAAQDVSSLLDGFSLEAAVAENEFKRHAKALYGSLSSGHKVVLLALTRLVEACSEQTLVIIDEPESHLHPPLLSAFMRALIELMRDQNSIAVIATHSPVVLQEIPRSCVLRIMKKGSSQRASRLRIETFGENVGTLTATVFGLEVTESGFNKLILDASNRYHDYDSVVAHFEGTLGTEARALIRAALADREELD